MFKSFAFYWKIYQNFVGKDLYKTTTPQPIVKSLLWFYPENFLTKPTFDKMEKNITRATQSSDFQQGWWSEFLKREENFP